MSLMILQIDFSINRSSVAEAEDQNAIVELAHQIKHTPGLLWKIWTENPTTQEAGGIYLFEDESTLDAYLAVHTERLKRLGIEQINAKKFAVNESLTQITRGEHCLKHTQSIDLKS